MSAGIVLNRADYFELKSMRVQVEHARLVLAVAEATSHSKLTEFGGKYGFDPRHMFTFDDSTCALVPIGEQS